MADVSVCVLGVGNLIEGDDAVGLLAAAYLEHAYRFDPPVTFVLGHTQGLMLMDVFETYRKILLIDTIATADAPGTLYHLPAKALEGVARHEGSAHETGVLETLELMRLMDNSALPEVTLLGIVPEEVSLRLGLGAVLTGRFDALIEAALEALKAYGICATRGDTVTTPQELLQRVLSHA